MKVFYMYFPEKFHGEPIEVIASPIFKNKEDCERFALENIETCGGSSMAEVELQ